MASAQRARRLSVNGIAAAQGPEFIASMGAGSPQGAFNRLPQPLNAARTLPQGDYLGLAGAMRPLLQGPPTQPAYQTRARGNLNALAAQYAGPPLNGSQIPSSQFAAYVRASQAQAAAQPPTQPAVVNPFSIPQVASRFAAQGPTAPQQSMLPPLPPRSMLQPEPMEEEQQGPLMFDPNILPNFGSAPSSPATSGFPALTAEQTPAQTAAAVEALLADLSRTSGPAPNGAFGGPAGPTRGQNVPYGHSSRRGSGGVRAAFQNANPYADPGALNQQMYGSAAPGANPFAMASNPFSSQALNASQYNAPAAAGYDGGAGYGQARRGRRNSMGPGSGAGGFTGGYGGNLGW